MLVEVAGHEDARLGQPAGVEDRADRSRQAPEVAAVEAHGRGSQARRHDRLGRLHGVVGVDEQRASLAEQPHVADGTPRSRRRNAITHECAIVPVSGKSNRRPASTFDVAAHPARHAARAARQRGFETVRAARSELDHHPARGRRDDARGLAGDRRLEREDREQRRLDESAPPSTGAVTRTSGSCAKTISPSSIGPDVARETKCRQYLVEEPDGRAPRARARCEARQSRRA